MKIKPCPFCGGTKIDPIYDGVFVELRCLQCGSSGTSGTIHKDITEHWNTRADKELDRLRAENAELKENVLLLQTEYLRQNPCTDPQDDIDELEREVEKLRAVNAELVEALTRLADEKYWKQKSILWGAFTAAAMVDIAHAALSRAEQAKPEVDK